MAAGLCVAKRARERDGVGASVADVAPRSLHQIDGLAPEPLGRACQ